MNVIWRWQRNFYYLLCAIIFLAIYSYSAEKLDFVYCAVEPECAVIGGAEILILVTSNAPNFELRQAQRLAYSADFLMQHFRAQRIFLVAQGTSREVMEGLVKEVKDNTDILLGQFEESYKLLHYKHLMG